MLRKLGKYHQKNLKNTKMYYTKKATNIFQIKRLWKDQPTLKTEVFFEELH